MQPRRFYQAFERTSSVICFVILLSVTVELVFTAYYITTSKQSDFMTIAEVQNYENRVENEITPVDEWTRTTFYWKNNLDVAGHHILFTIWYSGISSEIVQSYLGGLVNTYWNYRNTMVPFRAAIETHGLLEVTGFFIITAITARLAWNFWKASGYFVLTSFRSESETQAFKRKLKKYRKRIVQLLGDFAIISSIGILLIFLAAPIEAYISPYIWGFFDIYPVFSYIFLVFVGLLYIVVFFLWFRGWEMMKKDAKKISGDVKSAFRGELGPPHLSLLMFVFFVALTLLAIFT